MAKTKSDEKLLASLDASLARDVLTDSYSDQQVAESLRAAGGDPDAIGRRGAELAARLLEKPHDWVEIDDGQTVKICKCGTRQNDDGSFTDKHGYTSDGDPAVCAKR